MFTPQNTFTNTDGMDAVVYSYTVNVRNRMRAQTIHGYNDNHGADYPSMAFFYSLNTATLNTHISNELISGFDFLTDN